MSRRQWCGRVLTLGMAAASGGCVVAPYGPYYRPSTTQPGARERRAWCQGQAGPVTGIDADLGGGLQLRAWTEKDRAGGLVLRLALSVPRATALRFAEPPRLLSDGRALAVALHASAQRTVAVHPHQWIDPQALRPGTAGEGESPHGRFTARTQPLRVPAPKHISVRGLSLVREHGATPLPPVLMARLASGTQPYAYRSAEEQAALLERAAACRRDTPRLACENIVDFAGASHSGGLPDARWQWRWWAAPHASGETVDGEFTLSLLDPARWRLDGERLRLRDEDGGTTHPLRLGPGVIAFSDRVDHQRGLDAAAGETRLLLEAPIPDAVAAFELALPALLRNGERVLVAPLRFNRRTFDAGVEPFNC